MAQMWVTEYHLKRRKSLGLVGLAGTEQEGKEVARFNIAYMLIAPENLDHVGLESRTLV